MYEFTMRGTYTAKEYQECECSFCPGHTKATGGKFEHAVLAASKEHAIRRIVDWLEEGEVLENVNVKVESFESEYKAGVGIFKAWRLLLSDRFVGDGYIMYLRERAAWEEPEEIRDDENAARAMAELFDETIETVPLTKTGTGVGAYWYEHGKYGAAVGKEYAEAAEAEGYALYATNNPDIVAVVDGDSKIGLIMRRREHRGEFEPLVGKETP